MQSQNTRNFALEPLQRVRGNLFQKSETANRKRVKSWSRNSTFNFQYITAEKIYDCA
jgi:hypothetical protein